MKDLPHLYRVRCEGKDTGNLITRAENLQDMEVAPPLQFGGPGEQWSPEDPANGIRIEVFGLSPFERLRKHRN